MTPEERRTGLDSSHQLQTERMRILDGLRSGSVTPSSVLAMGSPGSQSVRLRDLLVLGLDITAHDAGYLLTLLGVHDWANCKISDISRPTAMRIGKAAEIYARDHPTPSNSARQCVFLEESEAHER